MKDKEVSKKQNPSNDDLNEFKQLVLWAKEQKIVSFSYKGNAINFHPTAFFPEPVKKETKTPDENRELEEKKANLGLEHLTDEEFEALFDAVE